LVILSDGFAEAETEPGQMLGEAGLVELVRGTSTARAQDLLEALVWEIAQRCGEDGLQDDLSGLVVARPDALR
ncbi:MAG: SpoIIE family protein phosphatase, partial [Pseudomonadota bacterium]